jgi:hypothetical protein
MNSKILFRLSAAHSLATLRLALLGLIFLVFQIPKQAHAQDRFQAIYEPATIQKHKIKAMTIELFAGLEGMDSAKIAGLDPDYKERFFYDAQGRPELYEATDISFRNHGTAGPHILARWEYSSLGKDSHRHDSTAFGHSNEWHFRRDSMGRSIADEMYLLGNDTVVIHRQYLYDLKGRLHKVKTNRSRKAEGLADDCVWVFYIHDNQSFNASSLSPNDMARCQFSLEYFDAEGLPVRRVMYDGTGAISETVLLNYDRTGKPIRVELLDGMGKESHAWVDVEYGRNGLVILNANGVSGTDNLVLGKLSGVAQALVLDQWADWRLLRELRLKLAGRETTRYKFSYDQAN